MTAEVEAEYDLRFTQRLVLQPRVELGFAAQDVRESPAWSWDSPPRTSGSGISERA